MYDKRAKSVGRELSEEESNVVRREMGRPAVHSLKILPEYFSAVEAGTKTFELRQHDRDFRVGDYLILKEIDPKNKEYTGKELSKTICYILHGGEYGLDKEYAILGLKDA